MVSYTICYVSGMPIMLKNIYFGTVLGYPSGVPREVNKRTPPKHQPESSDRHLGGPKMILGSQRGPRLWQNPVKTLSWKACPDFWGAKWVQDSRKTTPGPKISSNSVPNWWFSIGFLEALQLAFSSNFNLYMWFLQYIVGIMRGLQWAHDFSITLHEMEIVLGVMS